MVSLHDYIQEYLLWTSDTQDRKNINQKQEWRENLSQLEVNEVVLVHCNIVNNHFHHDSRVLCTFVPDKSFGQLLNILPTNHIYSETLHSEFSYIKVWFIDQNSMPLEIEIFSVNLILAVINTSI